jgi:hypothetical protein
MIIGGMKTQRGESTVNEKLVPALLHPTQILHGLAWDLTWATAGKGW